MDLSILSWLVSTLTMLAGRVWSGRIGNTIHFDQRRLSGVCCSLYMAWRVYKDLSRSHLRKWVYGFMQFGSISWCLTMLARFVVWDWTLVLNCHVFFASFVCLYIFPVDWGFWEWWTELTHFSVHLIFVFSCHQLMELELKKMFDVVQSIHDEMFYLRERWTKLKFFVRNITSETSNFSHATDVCSREEEMQELNKSTNSKMAWLSFLSLFVCLTVAGLQLWHLKSFFEKKKLI